MWPTAFFRLCMIFIVFFCSPRYSVNSSYCETPPFDTRRCYQLYTDFRKSWIESSEACRATGQRLASLENKKLLDFAWNKLQYLRVWVGLRRAADGQPDKWTNGWRLTAGLYPDVVLNVGRSGLDNGKLCSVADKYVSSALVNTNCSEINHRICETVKANIYKVRRVGDVVRDVSIGQQVSSDVISILECLRRCHGDLTCHAISHAGVTCKLHFQQAGSNITVTSHAVVYELLALSYRP